MASCQRSLVFFKDLVVRFPCECGRCDEIEANKVFPVGEEAPSHHLQIVLEHPNKHVWRQMGRERVQINSPTDQTEAPLPLNMSAVLCNASQQEHM